MKFVVDTIYRSKVQVEIEEEELAFYKHCLEEKRARLSRANDRHQMVATCDRLLGEIDQTISDMKRKRVLKCVS